MLGELARHLRSDASVLRRYGDDRLADVCEQLADEIEEAIRAEDETVVTLEGAAALSGYTPEHLGRLIREGTIENAGRKYAPRIRRRDVPTKPGFLPPTDDAPQLGPTSTRQIVRVVANSVE